jgi:hypothetical protein
MSSSAALARRARRTLCVTVLVAACGDGPTEPPRTPTAVQAQTPTTQTATAGTIAPVDPVVLVRDQDGDPMPGVTVRFEVTGGGGSVQFAVVQTDQNGRASAGDWTLGPLPATNTLEARVADLAPVRFNALGESPWDIDVRFIGNVTPRQQQAVERAVDRWREVIVGELADIPLTAPAAECFPSQPALNETIDDLLIFFEVRAIDGPGEAVGQGGPCYIRNDNDLPVLGYFTLDAADVNTLVASNTIDDVVLHEFGHIIGFGTLWEHLNLVTGAGGPNPQFTGTNAVTEYHRLLNTEPAVPVENTGGPGTRDSHWRESEFGNELMTGFLNAPPNPMSSITIASLADLGYDVDLGAAGAAQLGARAGAILDLHGGLTVVRPRYHVGRDGAIRRIAF